MISLKQFKGNGKLMSVAPHCGGNRSLEEGITMEVEIARQSFSHHTI